MLIGREVELNQLMQYYNKDGSQIVVLYGQKNIGKTSLIKQFAEGKECFYYQARTCSEREQRYQWAKDIQRVGKRMEDYPSYTEIFAGITDNQTEKKIIIIDEFQYIVKTGSSFMEELVSFVRSNLNEKQIMVVLCSSFVGWVENDMLQKLGKTAYSISGLIKLKELKFSDLTEFFPYYSMEQCLECYSVLGGVPGLWAHFDGEIPVKENLVSRIISRKGSLADEAISLMSEELREPAVYSTILAAIAGGKRKLNDLYMHTGFSRAKISVYLKNLMELEIVEKIFSFETEGKDQTQKGLYRIKNHLIYFYFRFVYPKLSELQTISKDEFYENYISKSLDAYVAEFFKDVCIEHLEEERRKGNLEINYVKSGEWVGKSGNLDVVAGDAMGNMLIANCYYNKPVLTIEEYEEVLQNAKMAKIEPGHIYLFTMGQFDRQLLMVTEKNPGVHLFVINAR